MGILHQVTHGPHAAKVLVKPISYTTPMRNHSAMHTTATSMPPPIKRAVKSSGAPAGFKPVVGVIGRGRHASPYQRSGNIHNQGPYAAKHRSGY